MNNLAAAEHGSATGLATLQEVNNLVVEGAVRQLATIVGRGTADREPILTFDPLGKAISFILAHFRCCVDDIWIANATRGLPAAAAVRAVCEQKDIGVREIELRKEDLKYLWGPVLAFRAGQPVIFVPKTFGRVTTVCFGAHQKRHSKKLRVGELESKAYTFYRTLGDEPLPVLTVWRTLFTRENTRDLVYAVIWGLVAAMLNAGGISLLSALVDWALPEGDQRTLGLLALLLETCHAASTNSSVVLPGKGRTE